MEKIWRIIIDGYNDGLVNMARDEVLLFCYPKLKVPTLRIYSWLKPFVSLGYFQKIEDTINLEECLKKNIGFVHRITGGSAIVHYKELTYSLICELDDLNLPIEVK
ncbi:MAG: hypothetical protein NC820_04035, partial [Candidatus Omnitrophica bacterium]|nr:hypothetical protein [Candidatus Omnitrophota bacterium]